MAAVWLLAVCLLGALLFTCRVGNERYSVVEGRTSASHVGTVNIAKYIEEHPEDSLAVHKDFSCAKIMYPSLTLLFEHVDPSVLVYSRLYNIGSVDASSFSSLVTVNRHASPDHIDTSVRSFAAGFIKGFPDWQMYMCVEPLTTEGSLLLGIDPKWSVDWIVFIGSLGDGMFFGSFRIQTRDMPACTTSWRDQSFYFDTIIISPDNSPESHLVLIEELWIDSYHFVQNKSELVVCGYVRFSPFDEPYSFNVLGTVISVNNTINNGVPPPHSHLTENGRVKLEFAGNNPKNWTVSCIDKPFVQNYTSTPHVFISVSFRDKANSNAIEPAIAGWVEFANEGGFRGCVRRADDVGEILPNASIPYLEYLVISQDGIYDEEERSSHTNLMVITLKGKLNSLELPFPDFPSCLESGFLSILLPQIDESIRGTLYLKNSVIDPHSGSMTYLPFFYYYITDSGNEIIDAFNNVFEDGYFPYVNSSGAEMLMQIIYPFGEPKTEKERIKVTLWYDYGCPVGLFSNGTCSSKKCSGKDTSGMKIITREKLTQFHSPFCPPLTIEVPCNLPPCNMKELTFFDNPPLYDTDLSWAWALIGVLAIVGIIGGVYYFINKKFPKKNFVNLN